MATKAATPSLLTFEWRGKDTKGKDAKGEVQATSLVLAKMELKRQRVTIKSIRKKKQKRSLFKSKKVKNADITVITRQLATMIQSGVPLIQSLDIIAKGHEKPRVGMLLTDVSNNTQSGGNLSESMAKHRKYFNPLYTSLIKVGEEAGTLDNILAKLASYREKTDAVVSKVKRALIYPATIVVVAMIVTSILLLFVIPQFAGLYHGSGAELPLLTKLVIKASHLLSRYGIFILIGLILITYYVIRKWKTSERFQKKLSGVALRTPILGPILHKSALARYSRTLATTFGAGVPIMLALQSVSTATGNALYNEAVTRVREKVSKGQMLYRALEEEQIFPHMLQQMTQIGEESGALETMMAKVSDFYEAEVDGAVEILTSLLEPIIIVVIGVIIGIIVVAMYLPIFYLGTTF